MTEEWARTLYMYGPFALLVFFVFVVERNTRRALRTSSQETGQLRKPLLAIWIINWIVIFGLVGFSVYAWSRVNLPREYVIRGKIRNLQYPELIHGDHGFFLRREYRGGKRFNYDWRLVTDEPVTQSHKVTLTFDRSEPERERVDDFELPLHPEFYNAEVLVDYDRSSDRLVLMRDGVEVELRKVAAPFQQARSLAGGSLFAAPAFAQEPLDAEYYRELLEARDPVIRRHARQELAEKGRAALPWIEDVLADPASSYRVSLGALIALNSMTGKTALGAASLEGVLRSLAHPDPVLSGVARSFIVRNVTWDLERLVAERLTRALEESPDDKVFISSLASAQLEILYNLGIEEKDRFGSRRPEDAHRIDIALQAFEKAWGMRHLAAAEKRIRFAKALYGWGHALHDRSWIERRSDGSRDPQLIASAQARFRELLSEAKAGPQTSYPYPHHLSQAAAYLQRPEPESLQGEWFVILGSFGKGRRENAERQAAELRDSGFEVYVADTAYYANFTDGFWAVVMGPYSQSEAEKWRVRTTETVPGAFVKTGW